MITAMFQAEGIPAREKYDIIHIPDVPTFFEAKLD